MQFDPRIYEQGWMVMGFAENFTQPITPVAVGSRRLIVVNHDQTLRVYDATCPHRGANLGYSGRLEEDGCSIICGFHDYRIRLAGRAERGLSVQEYPSHLLDGILFAQLSAHGPDFESFILKLNRTHRFVPGFQMALATTPDLVVENGFDGRHFLAVHGISNDPQLDIGIGAYQEIYLTSEFDVPGQTERVGYECHAFSPCLGVVHSVRKHQPYYVITGATPTAELNTMVHLSFAFDRAIFGEAGPDRYLIAALVSYSRKGLEDDKVMWESLDPAFQPRYMPQDGPMRFWHEYCAQHYLAQVPA